MYKYRAGDLLIVIFFHAVSRRFDRFRLSRRAIPRKRRVAVSPALAPILCVPSKVHGGAHARARKRE